MALVLLLVPSAPGDRSATGRRELAAFREPQVWLTLLVGAVGFGGMFAMYSYIAPTVTDVTGLSKSAVPVFLLVFGLGAFAGTLLGGRLADWSVLRSLVASSVGMGLALVAVHADLAPWFVPGLLTIVPHLGGGRGAGREPAAAADGRRRSTPRRSAPRSTTPRSTSATRSAPGSAVW